MRKADKLFQMTNLIRARAPITAQQIADEMGMSVRSVYRYIDDLSASGIPVYGITGEGYRLTENYELPPLSLTSAELEALMLGVAMVKSWTGDTLGNAAKSLQHKIESIHSSQAQQVASNLPVGVPGFDFDKTLTTRWEQLYLAVKQQLAIDIHYEDAEYRPSKRMIYPLGIFYWGGKWTLGSWCCLRSDYRTFRLDRIIEMSISEFPFPNEPHFTKSAYITAMECEHPY